jgi:hypothetical protein
MQPSSSAATLAMSVPLTGWPLQARQQADGSNNKMSTHYSDSAATLAMSTAPTGCPLQVQEYADSSNDERSNPMFYSYINSL